ncbi:Armadillo repeat-containing protein 2 [Quaeritorhiza haematococci]|nr:Armadillo repeat-containing protein 2 [Quaeritorhiza haematococci]
MFEWLVRTTPANSATTSAGAPSSPPAFLLVDSPHHLDTSVYMIGVLKNLTQDPQNQRLFAKRGCIERMVQVLSMFTQSGILQRAEDEQLMQIANVLIQVTATLRNLATNQHQLAEFLRNGALKHLMAILDERNGLTDSAELMLNVSRIVSKLSLHNDCLVELSSSKQYIDMFVQLIIKYQYEKDHPQPLLIRVCFILGNLTTIENIMARSPTTRPSAESHVGDGSTTFLSPVHEVLHTAVPDLVALLDIYIQGELAADDEENGGDVEEGAGKGGEEKGVKAKEAEDIRRKENEDLLIKLIRFIANIAIDPTSGLQIVEMIEMESLVDLFGTTIPLFTF